MEELSRTEGCAAPTQQCDYICDYILVINDVIISFVIYEMLNDVFVISLLVTLVSYVSFLVNNSHFKCLHINIFCCLVMSSL